MTIGEAYEENLDEGYLVQEMGTLDPNKPEPTSEELIHDISIRLSAMSAEDQAIYMNKKQATMREVESLLP